MCPVSFQLTVTVIGISTLCVFHRYSWIWSTTISIGSALGLVPESDVKWANRDLICLMILAEHPWGQSGRFLAGSYRTLNVLWIACRATWGYLDGNISCTAYVTLRFAREYEFEVSKYTVIALVLGVDRCVWYPCTWFGRMAEGGLRIVLPLWADVTLRELANSRCSRVLSAWILMDWNCAELVMKCLMTFTSGNWNTRGERLSLE